MIGNSYKSSDLHSFLMETATSRANIVQKLTSGGPVTSEKILSNKKNTRDELTNTVILLRNDLKEALNWIQKIHSAPFETIKKLTELQDIGESKTLEAIKEVSCQLEKMNEDRKNSLPGDGVGSAPLDWSKIKFEKAVADTVSKTMRTERKKEQIVDDRQSSFVLFGVNSKSIGEQENCKWTDYDSLVEEILADCDIDRSDFIKWRKLG